VDDEISLTTNEGKKNEGAKPRRFIPMSVGEAAVYVEVTDEPPRIDVDEEIYAASSNNLADIFGDAGKILKEIVSGVGEHVAALGDKTRPEQVSVEFALSFEAGGKAHLIPVLFTGETKAVSGLKVTAVWGTASADSRDI